MPFYSVLILGEGIRTRIGAGGFYTSRAVFGVDEAAAARSAMAQVERDWKSGRSARLSPGKPPVLSVEESRRIGLLQFLRAVNRGHTFFPPE